MYDIIIIGIGSMGSAALYNLSKQGAKVLGLEQFEVVHNKGSHSGQTRIIRKSYFEHSDYVPLLESSYKGWDLIQKETGKHLFHKTGLLYLGRPDHEVMRGIKKSSQQYKIPLEQPIHANDFKTIKRDYSIFNIPTNFEGLLEQNAGFVLTEETISTYVDEAKKNGAILKTGEEVLNWGLKNGIVNVSTDKGLYKAKKLIIASGAYTQKLLPPIKDLLCVTRQVITWIKPENISEFEIGKFPCWVLADNDLPGVMYGFPILNQKEFKGLNWMKVAHHFPNECIEPRELHSFNTGDEQNKIQDFLKKYIPKSLGEIVSTTTCMYTNTKDGHFIIDFAPETNNQVIIATGFSGHGFKFVPVIGEILSDLALEGKTNFPIDFLRLKRFEK
tara:strand:+ start:23656 stop:24816 length:1161 start_codon:yes stop_codon:yes gene_type:complete